MFNLKFNKQAALVALIVTAGSSMSLAANADSGVYIGGAGGESRVNDSDFDDNNRVGKAIVGGKFNNYIGVEAAYNDFGDGGNNGYTYDLTGETLALVGYLPFTDSFNIFAKVGNLWWDDDAKVLGVSSRHDGEEIFYALGMNFNFTKVLTLRVELERYKVELSQDEIGPGVDGSFDLDVATVGVLFNF